MRAHDPPHDPGVLVESESNPEVEDNVLLGPLRKAVFLTQPKLYH